MSLNSNGFNIILGKNTSGKTTLVELILNMHKYTGIINISLSPDKIGVVTQNNSFIDGNVLDNLIFPLENLKVDNPKSIVYNFANMFDVDRILYKEIEELNFSEKKIIQILMSIIHKPKFIIIDDQLDDLEYKYRVKVLNYLKEISKHICVLMLVSSSYCLKYADNIFLFNDGVIVKKIKFDDLIDEEKLLAKMNVSIPFLYDLQNKLKFYNVLDEKYKSIDEVVKRIWK